MVSAETMAIKMISYGLMGYNKIEKFNYSQPNFGWLWREFLAETVLWNVIIICGFNFIFLKYI